MIRRVRISQEDGAFHHDFHPTKNAKPDGIGFGAVKVFAMIETDSARTILYLAILPLAPLKENMQINGASGNLANRFYIVSATRRALRAHAHIEFRPKKVIIGWQIAIDLSFFNTPNLLDGLQLAQVFNARIELSLLARFEYIWDGDGDEQTDDAHHNHDFNQREPPDVVA
jgi:hypothetical protein